MAVANAHAAAYDCLSSPAELPICFVHFRRYAILLLNQQCGLHGDLELLLPTYGTARRLPRWEKACDALHLWLRRISNALLLKGCVLLAMCRRDLFDQDAMIARIHTAW